MKPIINDYIFYKITCENLPEFTYIGSTVHFIKRKCDHKTDCNNKTRKGHNIQLYQTIRANGGWENWEMVVIDKGEQMNLTDARIKEESLRKEYNGNLNMVKAYRSEEDKKEYNKANSKEYRENNRDKINEKVKEYNNNHKEQKQAYQKEYYENNKVKFKEYQSKKITCICGCELTRGKLPRHLKTNKHMDLLKHSYLSATEEVTES